MSIDSRLLDSACQANIDENFDRTLAIVDAGGGLPEIAAGDAGKVLTVNDDADGVEWASGGGGGGASVLVVTATDDGEGNYTLNKTFKEIKDAFPLVVVNTDYGDDGWISAFVTFIGLRFGEYGVMTGDGATYYTSTENGYPVMNEST